MSVPRLKEKYKSEVFERLREQFSLKNPYAVPKVTKVVINMGLGKALTEKNRINEAVKDLGIISGQKALVRKARRSVATYHLREGNPIGAMVTLRRERMYEFLDRLISVVIPRIRDFRGLNPKAFDGRGNYNMGLVDQIVFPEVKIDKVAFVQGMNISIVTTAENDEQAHFLLSEMGLPFKKPKDS